MRFRLLLVLTSLLVALALGELALRLTAPAPRYSLSGDPANRLPGLLTEHPTRGYALTPGFEGDMERDGRRVRIAVNRLGLRGDELPPAGSAPLILAAGDSFTVGFGIDADEAWPQRLANHLGELGGVEPVVANAAVSGYGLQQIRLTVEELVPRLDPDLVVVGAYPGGAWRIENPYVHYADRLVNQATLPRLAPAGEGFVYSAYETPWLRRLHHWTGRHFHLGYQLLRVPPAVGHRLEKAALPEETAAKTAERLRPFFAELDRIDAFLDRHATPWVVLLIHPADEGGGFSATQLRLGAAVAEHLRDRQIPVVDPVPRLAAAGRRGEPLRFSDDHHWNHRAHDLAATALAEALAADWPRSRS